VSNFDAIIIGAGPAGLMLAIKLRKLNLEVLVLDRLPHIKRKVCGEYLCPKGVELLEREDLLPLLNDFPTITGMNLFSPKGKRIESHFIKEGRALNRAIFDQRLCEKALSLGVKVKFDQQIIKIDFDKDRSHHVIESQHGEHYTSKLLVGADGRSSFVAKHFGLNIESHDHEGKKIALHLHARTKHSNSRQGEMHLFTEGDYIGLDPSDEHMMNITLVCDQQKLKGKKPKELLLYYLEKSESLKGKFVVDDQDKVEMVYPLSHKTSTVAKKNVALVGDAASFIDPLTGEGIYQALLSATLLATNYPSLELYRKAYRATFRQKKNLNTFFQFFIRRENLLEIFASLLQRSQRLADIFINIIGNIYTPTQGFIKALHISRR
jgi:menaquinone-9 beta-reductase